MKKLVFIGDSLTEWFDWQKRFLAYKVSNLGIAGEGVEGLLERLDRIIARTENPDFIFIMSGINNLAMEDFGVIGPYREIIERLSSAFTESCIIVQSILPVILPWVKAEEIERQNKMIKELAPSFSAEYLDIYSLFIDPDGRTTREFLMDDGVHLSNKGYEVWANAVEGFLSGNTAYNKK